MSYGHPGIAQDPRHFGRAPSWRLSAVAVEAATGDDLRLFATTFLAGFIFVSLLLA